ncbi:MAG TPA: hypothetical protein V6C76_12045 [Drouetiella sp.]
MSQVEAAEFLRERTVKRILWSVIPSFRTNDLELLCRKRACEASCESRGRLVDAQNIANKALTESNLEMKVRLARASLNFDARCVDAHIILAKYERNRFISREQHCQNALNAGIELRSYDTGLEEDAYLTARTKPYLRALAALADYQQYEDLDSAIRNWEKLLEIDFHDYTATRQNYAVALLKNGLFQKADALCSRYPELNSGFAGGFRTPCLGDTDEQPQELRI